MRNLKTPDSPLIPVNSGFFRNSFLHVAVLVTASPFAVPLVLQVASPHRFAVAEEPAGSEIERKRVERVQRMLGERATGGKGLGVVGPMSPEKIAYSRALSAQVKSKWRWTGSKDLRAQVLVKLHPTGQIEEVRVEKGSGDSAFDDAVVQAVRNSSPVPPPPAGIYNELKEVRFTFDSRE